MNTTKQELIEKIESRVADKALERSNADLLIKLINNADSIDEAISIAALGTMYKRTGLHFDPRLEKMSNTIKYFEKNEALSFTTPGAKRTHKLIIGDNYDALQNLLIQYKGKIDVIYIDPPYGKDSMGEFADTNYDNAITRDNLLSMLYPRLILARQLLSNEGVIYCSIDDTNQAYVKCLFDEVFGERNFITTFIWEKTQHFGRQKINYYSNVDYVVCYAKEKKGADGKIKELLVEKIKTELEDAPLYNQSNPEKTLLFPAGTVKFNIPDGVYTSSTDEKYKLVNPVEVKNRYNVNDFELCFRSRWARQTVIDEIAVGTSYIVKSTNFAIRAIYSDGRESKESPKQIIFTNSNNEFVTTNKYGIKVGTNEDGSNMLYSIIGEKAFDYPKAISLISYLVSLTNKKNAVVLDFFAGSGTTGHAVLDLDNNKEENTYILCQLNEITDRTPNGIAYDVTSKRLKRIMTGECYDGSKDFEWIKKNKPYGDNLDVYEIKMVADNAQEAGQTPFDLIDETLYGKEKFATMREKIEWVCQNFQRTEKYLEE